MKYRLTEKIGSGGMAEVFRAVGEGPEGFERSFVVKQIHPRISDAAEFVRMFVDEAKISGRLLHPNIVQVFEFVYQAGCYYLVMEPVDGVDMGRLLQNLISRGEVPPPTFVAEVAHQACRGLEFAHTLTGADGKALGIVHRDVTPPNVMVSWTGTVKLLDFGLARAVQEIRTNLTEAGTVKGKMAYIAPELLQGRTADARSDVFSLGVVMHELLTGQRLFSGENDLETFKRVLEMPIVRPGERNPGVKPSLDAVVMRALERDPEKRFQTAEEMGDKLESLVVRARYSTRLMVQTLRDLVRAEDLHNASDRAAADTGAEGNTDGKADGKAGDGTTVGSRTTVGSMNANERMIIRQAPTPAIPFPAVAAPPVRRWPMALAVAVPAVLAGALAATAVRRPAPMAALAPGPSVTVSLDSLPQGASVTGEGGAGLGETPVLLTLARGEQPVQLMLSKPGFAPTSFKVIPNRDKDAAATLAPESGSRPFASGGGAAVEGASTAATGPTAATTTGAPAPTAVVTTSPRRRRTPRRDTSARIPPPPPPMPGIFSPSPPGSVRR
jgi:eukaryotic-like serine/threonine-protein kinase